MNKLPDKGGEYVNPKKTSAGEKKPAKQGSRQVKEEGKR